MVRSRGLNHMIWGTHILDGISNTIYGIYDLYGEVGAQVDMFLRSIDMGCPLVIFEKWLENPHLYWTHIRII